MNFNPILSAIKQRKITLFAVIVLMVMGIYNYQLTPKQEFPDVSAPAAYIQAIYPGASPEDIESLVTSKLENMVSEIPGFNYSNSISRNSESIVIIYLTQDADIDEAWDVLKSKVDEVKTQLPDEVTNIYVNTDLIETAGMIISMSGENYSYEELESFAEELKSDLSKIDGVERFEITGKQEKQINITIDVKKLNYYNLSMEDIVTIIRAQNTQIPLGNIETKDTKISVQSSGIFNSIEEIENTIVGVSENTGATVRLKDIADVTIELEDSNYKIKHNGENAILLTGYFEANKNIILVGKEVESTVNAFKAALPQDLSFDQVVFQPEAVEQSVNDFIKNLLQAVLFVIIVVFIGMGFRNAIIVSTSIPVSILATFTVMYLVGIQIHQMSVSALIIALGMLVDNAIVVSDAIQVKIDNNEEKLQACINGVKEVAIPILTSTLTTVGAFLPLLLLNSAAGIYIRSIPQIVGISLFASYLTALFVTPTMAYVFFKPSKGKQKDLTIRKSFDWLLRKSINHKGIVAVIIICVVVISGIIINQLGLQFFPKADKNIVYIDIRTEKEGDIQHTEKITEEINNILEKQEEIVQYTCAIGSGLPKFYSTMLPVIPSQDFAQILIHLDLGNVDRFDDNSEFVDYLQDILDQNVVGATATVKELQSGPVSQSSIGVRVSGGDIERINEVTEQIKGELLDIEGAINIEDDMPSKEYQYFIDIDHQKAALFGITKYDIQKEVGIALKGVNASSFRSQGQEYIINVKGNISSVEELRNLEIKSTVTGQKVILKEMADIELSSKLPSIQKHDKELSIFIGADADYGYSPVDIQNQLAEKIKDLNLEGVKVDLEGENKQIQDNFGDLGRTSIFAVILVYLILLLQFKSFMQPLIILLTIPLAGIGSVLGLYITNEPLSFTALLGIVSLMGIVVNNAIVLIDYINSERDRTKSLKEACLQAVEKRFRPIILSTTTTVIGLIPLVISGGAMFRPMAIALMSGLLLSTMLTLVIIPLAYYIVEDNIPKLFKVKSI